LRAKRKRTYKEISEENKDKKEEIKQLEKINQEIVEVKQERENEIRQLDEAKASMEEELCALSAEMDALRNSQNEADYYKAKVEELVEKGVIDDNFDLK